LIKLFLKFRPDIIHLNSSKVSIVGSLASAIYRLKKNHKLIYTVHGFVFNEPLGQKIKTLYYWLERFCALFKDKLICIYQADMDQAIIKKIAPARKFTVVYNGINKINYLERSPARNALGIPDDKIIIGNIANFYPTKGLIYLVRAAKLVCEKIPNALFVLIGEGEERKNIEKEIRIQNLEEKFLLLGAKPGASIYFKAFDIFALSSLKEGLPYSLLEAMQAGLPCVATKVGGNMEIINDKQNGLLVDAADPELLANAINLLIANEELAKNLSQKAQSTISGKFSLNKMIENTINNY
jgi:glycosyltransferase involved in cell wall biosynthesis